MFHLVLMYYIIFYWFFMVYPGHEESYNPSIEYIPTQEEIDSYQLMYEEDHPKFIPKRYYLPFYCPLSYIV